MTGLTLRPRLLKKRSREYMDKLLGLLVALSSHLGVAEKHL